MKRYLKNERGITLIELLAVLTILVIIIGLLYSTFINGLNYSTKAKDTVNIQQEANTLLTLLKKQHEKGEPYSVKITKDNISEVVIEGATTTHVNNTNFEYHISDFGTDSDSHENDDYLFYKQVTPLTEDFSIKLMIKSKNDPNLKFEVETILSRLQVIK